MSYRVLFLDFDGVLNSWDWFRRAPPGDRTLGHLDPEAVARVQQIVDRTGAVIVISSTWRYLHTLGELRSYLAAKGLKARVIGRTPSWNPLLADRGEQIAKWLQVASRVAGPPSGMAILDDDSDMGPLLSWLVKTSFATGLTEPDVERAVAVLSRPLGREE